MCSFMQTSVDKTHDHTRGYILDFHVFDVYWIAVALFLLLSRVRVFPVLLFEVFTVIWDFFFFFSPFFGLEQLYLLSSGVWPQ